MRSLPLALVCALALSSCWMLPIRWKRIARVPEPAEEAPRFQVRTHYWPGTQDRQRQVSGHFHSNGRFVLHGTQVEWYRSGGKRSEKRYRLGNADGAWTFWHENGEVEAVRTWCDGEPCGRWRSWHPNGVLASTVPMDDELAPTTWWHDTGVVSSCGLARRAVREGEWVEYWTSGAIRAFGPYAGGERNGVWTFLWEDGSLRMQGRYLNNARTGPWERWEPGARFHAADLRGP